MALLNPLVPLPLDLCLRVRDALVGTLPLRIGSNGVATVNWWDLWEARDWVQAGEVAHVLRQMLELRLIRHVVIEDWMDDAVVQPLQDLWEACPSKCILDAGLFMEIPPLEDPFDADGDNFGGIFGVIFDDM